ncbi:Uncharacterised protein [Vibrio cholerae]|nr:Uncharacterised protein [Vibrio cholerae]
MISRAWTGCWSRCVKVIVNCWDKCAQNQAPPKSTVKLALNRSIARSWNWRMTSLTACMIWKMRLCWVW